jgi:spore maturation protein CgeB
MKYFEVMASGTLLLTNTPEDCEAYGFKPGKHFAVWKTLHELEYKIDYFLNNKGIREEVATAGMELVRREYSTEDIAIKIQRQLELMV